MLALQHRMLNDSNYSMCNAADVPPGGTSGAAQAFPPKKYNCHRSMCDAADVPPGGTSDAVGSLDTHRKRHLHPQMLLLRGRVMDMSWRAGPPGFPYVQTAP